jgi:hypothetical protein
MVTKKLSERFAAPLSGGKVDRAKGVIHGVLVCGTTSANRRSYPWGKGLTCDPAKYEGRPVNADHGQTATISRRLGWLENVTVSPDGRPRADLHILQSHPSAAAIFEAAERNPSLFGLSHVAVCRTRMEQGTEVIESIESVESVDLVADPATTSGIFESKTMPTTLRTFLESVGKRKPAAAKWSRAKWVREMDEMPMDLPAMPEEMPTEEAEDAVMSAFKTAISSVVDQAMSGGMDPKEALGKIKALLRSHGDINGDGKVDAADVDAADDSETEEMPAMESKGAKYVLGLMADLEAAGLKVTTENLDTVGVHPQAKRPALLKRLAEAATPVASRPKTSGRDTTTLSEDKQTTSGGNGPPDIETIVEYFRG